MLSRLATLVLPLVLIQPAAAETLTGLDLKPGDRLVWSSGGEQYTETVESVADGLAIISSTRDGTYAQPLHFVLPPARWAGGPDGNGMSKVVARTGELFPLAPDRRMSVTYHAVSDQEPEGWTAVRVCSVGTPSEVEVAAGHFSVLPVACQERNRSRTWLFAPEPGLVVWYNNTHRCGTSTVEELVAVERAPRP